MRKLKILVDMDDTMEQLLKPWLKWVNDRYDRCVRYEDIRAWDISAPYPGLTREQVYEPIIIDEFWDLVEPMPDAAEVLKEFQDRGHELFVVTAHPYESVRAKMERHLFRHFPFINWDHVIITSQKMMIKGDVLIDDGIHNLEGADYAKILVTAPYNQSYDAEGNGMVRCNNWQEIKAAIAVLEQQ